VGRIVGAFSQFNCLPPVFPRAVSYLVCMSGVKSPSGVWPMKRVFHFGSWRIASAFRPPLTSCHSHYYADKSVCCT